MVTTLWSYKESPPTYENISEPDVLYMHATDSDSDMNTSPVLVRMYQFCTVSLVHLSQLT